MVNKIILIGRLTADVDMKFTQSGKKVGKFNMAVDKGKKDSDGKREADFFSCQLWQENAERAEQYLHKGTLAYIEGRIESREYTTQDGQKRKVWEVQVGTFRALNSKKDNGNNGSQESAPAWGPEQFDQVAQAAEMSDDVPF
ncbi:MAG: single-stranded DNA-binding protein [Candidatus Xenobiia bacterium LiM19]